jgi:hypothetical protein
MTKCRQKYRVIGFRVFNPWEDEAFAAYVADYRSQGRSVRRFTREVRAGGTSSIVYVAIVREAVP